MNFDANEIKRQANRVLEEVSDFEKDCNRMIIALHDISATVKSEDSDLSTRCTQYANSYINYSSNLTKKFTNLANVMLNYANQSLKNQEQLSKEMAETENVLQDANSTISSIADSVPEMYVDFD